MACRQFDSCFLARLSFNVEFPLESCCTDDLLRDLTWPLFCFVFCLWSSVGLINGTFSDEMFCMCTDPCDSHLARVGIEDLKCGYCD